MKHLALTAALLVLGVAGTVHAEENGAQVYGSLAWMSSDRLNLVGDVGAEVPLVTAGPWRVFGAFDAQTAIQKTTSDVTFLVDHVSYAALFGGRRTWGDRGALELFAGERGSVATERPGRLRIRLAGAAWESAGYRRAFGPPGWSGRVWAAAVLEDHDLSAVAGAGGEVRYLWQPKSQRLAFGGVVTVDALIGDDDGYDASIGPRLEFDMGGDRRFGLFAKWLHGGHPLGLGTDGVLAGFDFAQGLGPGGAGLIPPEVSGSWAAGAGLEGRGLARLNILVVTPPFLYGTTAEAAVDASVLSASDLTDLFYTYDVGFAHEAGPWRAGLWFHHRSNHVVDGPNPEITSINVLEVGMQSPGWNRGEPAGPEGRWGVIDAHLHGGWLIDSAFGEDTEWHARGGVRWSSPTLGAVRLYVAAELERGDVALSKYSGGALLPRGWDVRVEIVHDEQLYSVDQRAKLAVATLRY